LVVSTSAVDCLERLVSEMTCYVSSGTLNPTHSLTHSWLLHSIQNYCATWITGSLITSAQTDSTFLKL